MIGVIPEKTKAPVSLAQGSTLVKTKFTALREILHQLDEISTQLRDTRDSATRLKKFREMHILLADADKKSQPK